MKYIDAYLAPQYAMALLPTNKGKIAEQEACAFLEKHGLQLITANYQCRLGEIDLIMRDHREIIFIEVRSRSRADYGNAVQSITPHKQMKIIKTALYFLQAQQWLNKVSCRFDVIGLSLVQGALEVDWIKNAFTTEQLASI